VVGKKQKRGQNRKKEQRAFAGEKGGKRTTAYGVEQSTKQKKLILKRGSWGHTASNEKGGARA